ncbi:unnamed protein product, partial [Effrenium voratum]
KRAYGDTLQDALQVSGSTSERALHLIMNAVQKDSNVSTSTFKRNVRKILAPAAAVFRAENLPAADGTHISCMMPDIAGIIRYMVRSSDPYRRLFLEMLEKHAGRLNLILYHDDIQGGNVLSPTPSKKATMVYFSFMEMHRAFLLSPAAWCVCGCLEYQQGQSLLGGLAAYMARVVEVIASDCLQPFNVGCRLACACSIGMFISDFEALRATFSCKGSAGLLPCLFCGNVLKKDSGVALEGTAFVEIDEADTGRFQIVSDSDRFAQCDAMLAQAHNITKAALEREERACGITLNEHAILFKPIRAALPPSVVLADCLHLYFSNGCASWELAMVLSAAREKSALELADLQTFAHTLQWQRAAHNEKKSPAWRKGMLCSKKFAEDGFRGPAYECRALVPLVRFFLQEVCNSDALRPEVRSFSALADICAELSKLLRLPGRDPEQLARLQSEHQRLYIAAYGRAACKPKHHHRMHLPLQASRLGVVCGCESMEAKHRVFKNCIADRVGQFAGGGIPAASLPRLLLSHVHELDQHDVFELGLRKPTECSALRQHLPRGDRSVPLAAKEARLPHVSVACGDVLRMRDEACVVRACCDNGSLLFIVQELRFDPCMQLVRASAGASWWTLSSNVKTVTELCVREALHPFWWLWETDQSLLCLE